MQSCRDVAYLIASGGLEHESWPTRLLTRLHLRRCKHCRRYAEELAMMGRVGREIWSADSVDPKTVQRLQGSIMDYALDGFDEGWEEGSDDRDEQSN